VELTLRREDAVIESNLTISSTCNVEVVPECGAAPGPERWSYLPEYNERTEANKEQQLPDGLPLYVAETAAVHASTSIADLDTKVGDQTIARQATPTDLLEQLKAAPGYSSTFDTASIHTLLYVVPAGSSLKDLPSGVFHFRNPSGNLSSYALAWVSIPVVSEVEAAEDVQFAADRVRFKSVHATNGHVEKGIPSRLRGFMPFGLADSDDKEFSQFAGLRATPGRRAAEVAVPNTLAARAAAEARGLHGEGESAAAASLIKAVASHVPGAQASGVGLSRGVSPVLGAVASMVK
jgi:hypothetical protein